MSDKNLVNVTLFIISVTVFVIVWLQTGNVLIAVLIELYQLIIYGLIAAYRGERHDNQRS